MTAVYAFVFDVFLRVDTAGIPTRSLPTRACSVAAVCWFGESWVPSIVHNMDLVTKIYFPREIIPIASLGIPLVDFAAGMIVLFILMAVYGIPISGYVLLLPVFLIIQILFTLDWCCVAAR